MHLVLTGLNYRSTPVELRERFAVAEEGLDALLRQALQTCGVDEVVIVSTCNRTEVYAAARDADQAQRAVAGLLCGFADLPLSVVERHLYVRTDVDAVRHLSRVVTGLDSMVLGETQILGQVRGAFLAAQAAGATGRFLNHAFNAAIALGKRVHTETGIGQSAVSVGYAAVSLAKKVFTQLSDKSVLLIGAGKMSELTLSHLYSQGVRKISVANRTMARARELAEKYHGRPLVMSDVAAALQTTDIVISSTGAHRFVLTRAIVEPAMKRRKQRPLFCIDIAVPRDVDPELARMDGIYIYDIDDLQDVVTHGFVLREREASRVEAMIEGHVAAFAHWRDEQEVVPLIAELRDRADVIQSAVLGSLRHKLPGLEERELRVLEKHMGSIVNQLLREPITNVKEMAVEPGATAALSAFARIFGLADPAGAGEEAGGAGVGEAVPSVRDRAEATAAPAPDQAGTLPAPDGPAGQTDPSDGGADAPLRDAVGEWRAARAAALPAM